MATAIDPDTDPNGFRRWHDFSTGRLILGDMPTPENTESKPGRADQRQPIAERHSMTTERVAAIIARGTPLT